MVKDAAFKKANLDDDMMVSDEKTISSSTASSSLFDNFS